MILDMEKYFATAKCVRKTSVYWIHKDQFTRLFKRKNPHTLKPMAKTLAMLMQNRSSREGLVIKVPLLKCMMWKLQEMSGPNKRKRTGRDDENSLSLLSDIEQTGNSPRTRPKSMHSNSSLPTMRRGSSTYSISSFRSAPFPLPSDNPMFAKSARLAANPANGSALVYSMPNIKAAENRTQTGFSQERHFLSKGDGIYLKLMQVGNPKLNRKHLDIDDEELEYLIALRRRMTRKLEDFNPFSNLEKLYGNDNGSKRSGQKGRGRSQPKKDSGTIFPALKGGKQAINGDRERSQAAASSSLKKKQRGILFKIE